MFLYGSSSLLWLYRFWCQYQYWPIRKRWYLFRNSICIGNHQSICFNPFKGEDWFQNKYVPFISLTLIALLFTIVIMFSLKENWLFKYRWMLFEIPLVIYFYFDVCVELHGGDTWPTILKYRLAFTATETISIGHRSCHRRIGINSGQAFAGVIGPLVEVPALIALVNVAFGFEKILSSRCIKI
jgi:ACR3 family arsenite efflux pump ArsB